MWPFLNNVTSSCGCTHCTPSTSICYTGVNLSCIGVNKNDTLSVALQKINALMCVPINNTEIIQALGYIPADDLNVVHKTGDEVIDGEKTFYTGSIVLNDSAYPTGGVDVRIINIDTDVYFKESTGTILFNIGYENIGLWKNGFKSTIVPDGTADRTFQLPAASGTIALVETIKPYKIYTALLNQTGTDDPIVNILENTIGNIVWTRNSVGQYIGTLANAFTANKTISPQFPAFQFEGNGTFLPISANANPQLGWINMYWQSTDVINLDTYDMVGSAEWSTILGSTFLVEIKVYN